MKNHDHRVEQFSNPQLLITMSHFLLASPETLTGHDLPLPPRP
jgi:hypothetical protein